MIKRRTNFIDDAKFLLPISLFSCYNLLMVRVRTYLYWGLSLLVVILLFSGIDYLFHSLKLEWAVPDYYFRNKIIFGFLWAIPALGLSLLFRKFWQRAFIFSLIIATVLQVRYYFEGYPLNFVLIFLFIHFVILFFLSLMMFRLINFHK